VNVNVPETIPGHGLSIAGEAAEAHTLEEAGSIVARGDW